MPGLASGEIESQVGKFEIAASDKFLKEAIGAVNSEKVVIKFTGELGELINKKISGRKSQNEITLFKTVGSAVLDLVVAELILQKAKNLKVGMQVEI
ncbi:hypothetical protein KMP12_00005 [Gemella sp. zg-1178]|nr:hypothetical protein [Gemella sp. zg-1178]